jgi:CBS domain-containing protein
MLAAVVADLVAAALMRETLMTEKLARRGLRVSTEYEVDVLRTTLVADVMSREVLTLPSTATVGRRLQAGGHGAYPLVDEHGRCVGIIARGDLLNRPAEDGDPVSTVASLDVVSVVPDDTVFRALQLMLEEEVEHLPVISDDRLAGICTRTDVLRARRRQMENERRERGAINFGF